MTNKQKQSQKQVVNVTVHLADPKGRSPLAGNHKTPKNKKGKKRASPRAGQPQGENYASFLGPQNGGGQRPMPYSTVISIPPAAPFGQPQMMVNHTNAQNQRQNFHNSLNHEHGMLSTYLSHTNNSDMQSRVDSVADHISEVIGAPPPPSEPDYNAARGDRPYGSDDSMNSVTRMMSRMTVYNPADPSGRSSPMAPPSIDMVRSIDTSIKPEIKEESDLHGSSVLRGHTQLRIADSSTGSTSTVNQKVKAHELKEMQRRAIELENAFVSRKFNLTGEGSSKGKRADEETLRKMVKELGHQAQSLSSTDSLHNYLMSKYPHTKKMIEKIRKSLVLI